MRLLPQPGNEQQRVIKLVIYMMALPFGLVYYSAMHMSQIFDVNGSLTIADVIRTILFFAGISSAFFYARADNKVVKEAVLQLQLEVAAHEQWAQEQAAEFLKVTTRLTEALENIDKRVSRIEDQHDQESRDLRHEHGR